MFSILTTHRTKQKNKNTLSLGGFGRPWGTHFSCVVLEDLYDKLNQETNDWILMSLKHNIKLPSEPWVTRSITIALSFILEH